MSVDKKEPLNSWEKVVYSVFILGTSLVCVIWAITICKYSTSEPFYTYPRYVKRIDSTTKKVTIDTTFIVSVNEYERILNQQKEQNTFLSNVHTTLVTAITFFAAFAALFVWRMQKKYDGYSDSLVELKKENDIMKKHCASALEYQNTFKSNIDLVEKTLGENQNRLKEEFKNASVVADNVNNQLRLLLKAIEENSKEYYFNDKYNENNTNVNNKKAEGSDLNHDIAEENK